MLHISDIRGEEEEVKLAWKSGIFCPRKACFPYIDFIQCCFFINNILLVTFLGFQGDILDDKKTVVIRPSQTCFKINKNKI